MGKVGLIGIKEAVLRPKAPLWLIGLNEAVDLSQRPLARTRAGPKRDRYQPFGELVIGGRRMDRLDRYCPAIKRPKAGGTNGKEQRLAAWRFFGRVTR